MFDDFDLQVDVEEISGYDDEAAFATWYQEDFHDYCDEVQRRSRSSYYSKNDRDFDEI